MRKDKVNLEKSCKDINCRIKNFCQQKGIGYIDNSNITENHLRMKKVNLNSKRNTAFAKNLINFVENWNESLKNLDFIKESSSVESSSTDCKSKSPISKDLDKNKSLRQFCKLYPKKIKITHIIINPIRNKLDLLSDQVKGNVDILMISETKIDKNSPTCQFEIDGFNTPFWAGMAQNGGDIMLYVREDLPVKFSVDW